MEDQSARIQSVKAQIQALEMELFRLQQQQAQYETEQRRKQQTAAVRLFRRNHGECLLRIRSHHRRQSRRKKIGTPSSDEMCLAFWHQH